MGQSAGTPEAEAAADHEQGPAAKSIILFADEAAGSRGGRGTSVRRMYEAVDTETRDGERKQIVYYHERTGPFGLKPPAILDGIFGFGLQRTVLDLYRFACRNYSPGDTIYAFGFGRGAFAIRTAIALIASRGLVRSSDERELRHRSAAEHGAFRNAFLPRRLPLPTKLWRRARDALIARIVPARAVRHADPARNDRPEIKFVGVWDTVAPYRTPILEITRGIDDWIYPLSGPDRHLHAHVQCARHALAIDDEREAMHPVLWDEVHEERLVVREVARSDRLQQVWFPGSHADLGGGHSDASLSYVPFLWMLGEAHQAGLRTLNLVTDRFRVLANIAGPIHDSRSGLGAYYRYQPRDIAAWLDPPAGTSTILDPDLKDEGGRPRGLLTSALVHESVIARIAGGTDGYAPYTLPARYVIVPPQAMGETAPQADGYPPPIAHMPRPLLSHRIRALVEDRRSSEERARAMGPVWDLVWRRRLLYFTTLLLTLALLTLPLWVTAAPDPPIMADGRTWHASLIRMLAVITPGFLDPAVDSMANNSFYVLLLAAAIAGSVWSSKATELRLRDRARAIWQRSLTGASVHPEFGSVVERLRTSPLYVGTFRLLKWRLLPALSAAAMVLVCTWLFVGAIAQLRLGDLERGSALCPRTGAIDPLTVRQLDFSPASPCRPTGTTVEKGRRYIVDIDVIEPWIDGSVQAGPDGLRARDLGVAGYAGIPFRRVITANYLQPALAIRRPPGPSGWRDGVHIEPLDFEREGRSPASWRAEFVAAESGELSIFANEAVPPLAAGSSSYHYFYRGGRYGNRGKSCMTIRRADLAGERPRARAGACAAVDLDPATAPVPVPVEVPAPYEPRPERPVDEGSPVDSGLREPALPEAPTAQVVLRQLIGFFLNLLGGAICVGIVVATLLNLLRPFIRKLYQTWTLRAWILRRSRKAAVPGAQDLPPWYAAAVGSEHFRTVHDILNAQATDPGLLSRAGRSWLLSRRLLDLVGLKSRAGLLPNELFMLSVQSEAQAALAQPTANRRLFAILAGEAPLDAQSVLLATDSLARDHPLAAARLVDPVDAPESGDAKETFPPRSVEGSTAPAIAAAENVIMAAAERALDELQLSLVAKGLLLDRLLALALGLALTFYAAWTLGALESDMVLVLGTAGGIVGLLFSDLAQGFFKGRSRPR